MFYDLVLHELYGLNALVLLGQLDCTECNKAPLESHICLNATVVALKLHARSAYFIVMGNQYRFRYTTLVFVDNMLDSYWTSVPEVFSL